VSLTKSRPVNERGERVTPSDFEAHRASHDVLGPCCLCPFQLEIAGGFKESVVFMVGHGRYTGEYVAGCADGQCNYFGMGRMTWNLDKTIEALVPVFAERLHGREGIPVRRYPLRGK
jgi:hypothetical protein